MADSKPKRVWTFLVYPESCVKDWKKKLDELFVPFVCSPLHEFDLYDDGLTKKAHWHVVTLFEGKKSYQAVNEFCQDIHATIPLPVLDTRKMIRYLIHIDDKDKYQYNQSDIDNHSGNDISKYFLPTQDECLHIVADIMRFIEANQVTEFNTLESYIRECRYDEWYYTFKCERNFFDMKIRSYRNAFKGDSRINK